MLLQFPAATLAPARIFCIGRNYAAHIREMQSERAEEPVVFMKPATSLVPAGGKVRAPRGRGVLHHEAELVLAVGREGWQIPEDQALAHLAGISLGLDLTLRALQQHLKDSGQPWERAKSFDQSAPIGTFVRYPGNYDLGNLPIRCLVNDDLRQNGNTADMLHSPARLIAFLSSEWALVPGDLIFTGSPAGVGPLQPGDRVTIESPAIGSFNWDLI